MKRHPPYTGTALVLFRTGILDRGYNSDLLKEIKIDVNRLLWMTDEELLKCRSIGPHRLKEVNAARKELKRLLFKDK